MLFNKNLPVFLKSGRIVIDSDFSVIENESFSSYLSNDLNLNEEESDSFFELLFEKHINDRYYVCSNDGIVPNKNDWAEEYLYSYLSQFY